MRVPDQGGHFGVGLFAAILIAATAAGAAEPRLTLVARPVITPPAYVGGTPSRTYVLEGVAAGARPGEAVDLLYKQCGPGTAPYSVFDSARTASGGSFSSDPVSDGYWRVRWNGILSDPVFGPGPLHPTYHELRRRIFRVEFYLGFGGQRLSGRFVELQRQTANQRWVRVSRAKLRLVPLAQSRRGALKPYYGAQFRIRTRGLRLRVFVPAQTAGPCYLPAWTVPTRS